MKTGVKTFNCPIHGHIDLSSLAVKIIDTPQFQRLRDISQLGGVYFVFPGASSKRFEHCIGVAHLARSFVEKLRVLQPELCITDVDVLCVEIAGLCHDLGHGPFSHLFDGKVLPRLLKGSNVKFDHEHASIGIFSLLIEENNLLPHFQKHGMNREDIHFIQELILGDYKEAPAGFQWKGRGDKTFLFDIVANKRNGIDVDKFDYFARDCHVLGVTKSFDALRLMRFARVHRVCNEQPENEHKAYRDDVAVVHSSDSNGKHVTECEVGLPGSLQICYHVKEAWNLFELFHTRYALHKRAYQHKVAGAVELMIAEAFIRSNDFIRLRGVGGTPRKMSEAVTDFHAYWRMSDYLLKEIENSLCHDLAPARHTIERLRKRDLFPFVGEILVSPDSPCFGDVTRGAKHIEGQLLEMFARKRTSSPVPMAEEPPATVGLTQEDLFCTIIKLGYGQGGADPVTELTNFYQPIKREEETLQVPEENSSTTSTTSSWRVGLLTRGSVSRLIPREFQEIYVRLYCRYAEQYSIAKRLFNEWCASRELASESLTPRKSVRKEICKGTAVSALTVPVGESLDSAVTEEAIPGIGNRRNSKNPAETSPQKRIRL